MDPDSGWWVVAFIDFLLRVMAYVLFGAYDNIRIWAVSPDFIRLAREFN